MGPTLDFTINQKLRQSFDNFFNSLQEGGNALVSFVGSWSSFSDTIRGHHTALQDDTLMALQSHAELVDTISNNVLDLETDSKNLAVETTFDITQILNDFGNLNIDGEQGLESSNDISLAAYIKPSYTWLLQNLHNPYPSKDMKKTIAQQSNRSIKDIDAWFIDVRKRIGWNKIRKSRFLNKQEKIIEAATRVFKPRISSFATDLDTSLISEMDQFDAYRADFLAMERKAKALYVDKFPELVASVASSFASPPIASNPVAVDPSSFYPTPKPSPYHDEESTPSSPAAISPETSPTYIRKRRLSSSSDSQVNNEEDIRVPPLKRLRSQPSPAVKNITLQPNGLVSDFSNNPREEQLLEDIPRLADFSRNERKRRLSESGDQQGPRKRPHNALCYPRLQMVSDPMPIPRPPQLSEAALSTWFQGTTGEEHLSDAIPPPTNTEDTLFPKTSVELDFHQYDFHSLNPTIEFSNTFLLEQSVVGMASTNSFYPHNLDSSTIFESLSYFDALQDFDRLDAPHLAFDLPDPTDNLQIFHSSTLGSQVSCVMSSSLLTNNAYKYSDELVTSQNPVPALGNIIQQNDFTVDGQEAKRARAQALREELAKLAAEGL